MRERTRVVLLALGAASYALLSHELTTRAPDSLAALLALLGPMAALVLVGLWRGGQRWQAVAGLLLCGVLALQVLALGRVSAAWLYLAQHAGIHATLAWVFGRTLRAPQVALVSQLAERVHGGLSPAMARYTRRLTAVWTAYFAGMALLSLLLYASAPLAWWSLLANVITPLALVAMFGGEYLLRYRLHPEFERVSPLSAMRAYAQHSQAAAAQPRRP